jgi:RNA recognition motif-containing protein
MNIFVAKLSPQTTGDDLRELFERYGTVDTAKVIFDHETGNSRGFGFVEMPNDDEGYQAVSELNDSDIHGSRVVIKEARPQGEYQADNRQEDRGYIPRQGGYERPNPYNNRPGYNDRGGYNSRPGYNDRGAYNNRGGYNDRGGYGNRGGYDRGGFDNNNRGGYDRGPQTNNRGGYDRGGYNNRGGYDRGGYNDRSSSFNPRDRFQPERRPPHRDDDDLYRFEEFIGGE